MCVWREVFVCLPWTMHWNVFAFNFRVFQTHHKWIHLCCWPTQLPAPRLCSSPFRFVCLLVLDALAECMRDNRTVSRPRSEQQEKRANLHVNRSEKLFILRLAFHPINSHFLPSSRAHTSDLLSSPCLHPSRKKNYALEILSKVFGFFPLFHSCSGPKHWSPEMISTTRIFFISLPPH